MYDMAESEIPGAEYDQNGNLVAKYHHEGGGLMAMTRNNSSYWYGFEAIGTVRQLVNAQSQVTDAYAFDAWGNELTSPQSQVSNPFKYVGKHGYYLDTQSALMLSGVRYYNANIGRFQSLDPIFIDSNASTIEESLNWYIYVANNPLNKLDPTGMREIKPPKPDKRNPEEFKRYAEYCGFECRKASKHPYVCKHKQGNVTVVIPNPHNPVEVWKKVLKMIQDNCTPPSDNPQPNLCPQPKPAPKPGPTPQPFPNQCFEYTLIGIGGGASLIVIIICLSPIPNPLPIF